MLDELVVSNLGIISRGAVEPGPGLIVVTGETGAGKTLLLGALQLMLGMPARSDLVGPAGDEARVEGRFLVDGEDVVVTRRVVREGRSRSYLNGDMAPLSAIGERVAGLVEVVAQHDQLLLGTAHEVRRLVDTALDDEGLAARTEYEEGWAQTRDLRALQAEIGGDLRGLERERSLAEWQAEEIAAAGFALGDDAELEAKLRYLRSAAELRELLGSAHRDMDVSRDALGAARSALRRAAQLDVELVDTLSGLDELAAVLDDLSGEVRGSADALPVDPSESERAEERLAQLNSLRRKYGATLDEVLEFGVQAAKRASELAALADRAATVDADLAASVDALVAVGARLRGARQAAGERLAQAAIGHLAELGLSDPHLEFDVSSREPHAAGADHVELRFASDARLTPGPVGRVASGGELSRLVLSVRLAAGAARAPVIAFDEIDAGVGGRTGMALGQKLARLACDRQVLAVTHLPQIAAFADTHIVVERAGAEAVVRTVDEAGRIEELARMLSGLERSEQSLRHATELRQLAAVSRAER